MTRRQRRLSKTWLTTGTRDALSVGAMLGWNAMALGLEASAVIGLRTLKLAKGGEAANTESRLMVAEKVRATMELQAMALTGALGSNPTAAAAKTVRHFAPKVRANLRRLSKS